MFVDASTLRRLASDLVSQFSVRLRGSLIPPQFNGTTITKRDVQIAKSLLRNPDSWHNREIVRQFEDVFATWNCSRFAFAFSAGRKALTACLEAVDLATGDEVILPGYTCIVVDNAVRAFGATPVYCDIELNTFGADLRSVQHCITENTKVVILPHLYGLVCRDYQQITDFCRSRCIYTIEDCAHSTGAIFRGRRVGNLADMAFYSCEWTKPLTTILGGIATTNNVQLSRRLCDFHDRCIEQDDKTINRMLRTLILTFFDIHRQDSIFAYPYHRFRWFIEPTASTSEEEYCGRLPSDYFTRMSAAAARIGIEQLSILDSLNDSRRETASIWAEWCKRSGYPLPTVISESEPIFLRFPILVEPERKLDTSWALKELGVRPGVWFKSGLHPTDVRLPECPNAEIAISRCINFPCLIGPDLFRRLRSQFLNRS